MNKSYKKNKTIMISKLLLLFTVSYFSISICLAKGKLNGNKSQKLKQLQFSHLEKAIRSEKLSKIIQIEEKKIRKKLNKKIIKKFRYYNFPKEDLFWNFLSEYWLIKNESKLKWDYQRADYKLADFVKNFLKKQGLYNKEIKILLVNSPIVYYAMLPTTNNKYIFILSNPFIKILDLSKLEISILFLQEILRNNKGITFRYLKNKKVALDFGSNFYKKKFPLSKIMQIKKILDRIYFEKGFSFKDQYIVTKEVDVYLKSDLRIWNSYLHVLKKIDQLVKTNALYKDYLKKFPSPELQINWLTENITKKSN